MGVTSLWQLYQSESITLGALSLQYVHRESCRGVRLGVDAYYAMAVACRSGKLGVQVERCVALGRLYEHLLNLLKLPVLPLFCFDGTTRPQLKRQRKVYTGAFHIEREFREMVAAFGFEVWSAPGEAEAELAMLCKAGVIDVVMTGDSDTMLFGTPRVVRTFNEQARYHDYRELNTEETTPHLFYDINSPSAPPRLDTATLVLFSLLAGGDYSDPLQFDFSDDEAVKDLPRGEREREREMALRLANASFRDGERLGHSLVDPLPDLLDEPDRLSAHVRQWRNKLAAHVAMPSYAQLIPFVPFDFPDIGALLLYIRPIVSSWDRVVSQLPRWSIDSDAEALRELSTRYLEWPSDAFVKRLAPALASNFIRKLAISQQTSQWTRDRNANLAEEGKLIREVTRSKASALDAALLEVDVRLDIGVRRVQVWVASVLADYALLALRKECGH